MVPKGEPICNIGKVMTMTERERTSFGQRLFDAREAAGLKQEDVCERIGIAQGTLSGLERSASASRHTAMLAKIYGVDAHWLATGQGQARPFGGDIHLSIVDDPPSTGVAQYVSQGSPTVVPIFEWGDLMSLPLLPPVFKVAAPDDALLPTLRAGQHVELTTGITPRPGDGILVADANGNWYLRLYRERRRGEWIAHATNEAFEPLESIRDGLVVLAVVTATEGRWS